MGQQLCNYFFQPPQAATAGSTASTATSLPAEGDGYSYQQYVDRQELWLDFFADTGDGGDGVYTVAAGLAAPSVTAQVDLLAASPGDEPAPAPAAKAKAASVVGPHPQQAASSPIVASAGASEGTVRGAPLPAADGPAQGSRVRLPRAEVILLGGDLAYPNPCIETYEQRLFGPFQDALPPPPHYHPGRLVMHKPDLPPGWPHCCA